MSWVDRQEKDFIIVTGDGKTYRPQWKNPSRSVEFNTTEFEFPEVEGTLVWRGKAKGSRYPLTLYFQGRDHLAVARDFEWSARDPRHWIVSHPYYGRLALQPLSLSIDNTFDNVSVITVEAVETITETTPRFTASPPDFIAGKKADLDAITARALENDLIPTPEDINTLTAVNETLYREGKRNLLAGLNAQEYFNRFNAAKGKIVNAGSDIGGVINTLQEVINYPALFAQSVRSRIRLLLHQFDRLTALFRSNPGSTRNTKKIYEATATTLVSATATAAISEADFQHRKDVIATAEDIAGHYDLLLENLDHLQTESHHSPESFIPNAEMAVALDRLLAFTGSHLFTIALNARQERTITLEEDANLITLTHRFTGLKANDSTIAEFIEMNDIGLNEYLQIKKGRKITYYV